MAYWGHSPRRKLDIFVQRRSMDSQRSTASLLRLRMNQIPVGSANDIALLEQAIVIIDGLTVLQGFGKSSILPHTSSGSE